MESEANRMIRGSTIGSIWQRWDPHLHTPATLLNNQFKDDWDGFLRAITASTPQVVALGVTDYHTLRSYKALLERHKARPIQNIELIFANIEMRLTVPTRTGQGINMHLLVSPDDPDHIAAIEERLQRLYFMHREQRFQLSDEGLTRLGRVHRSDPQLAEMAALSEGANQFKVDLPQLQDLMTDKWMRENVLVGVAAGNDGLGGLAQDAAFASRREEIGRFADFIFSGNPAEREYWLGGHAGFAAAGHVRKPCLHGSDAHQLDGVLRPEQDRYCWIRGEATFEALRQALVEPERRTWIGATAPSGASAGNVISHIKFHNAPWMAIPQVEFNDGLVSIIGEKGSGKTALADLVALGCGAQPADPSEASFLMKAAPLLRDLKVDIGWADGAVTRGSYGEVAGEAPRARYLSQQFVEKLCGTARLADDLVKEIEQVIFNSISPEDRMECSTFEEYSDVKMRSLREERQANVAALVQANQSLAQEEKLIESTSTLEMRTRDSTRQRELVEATIRALPNQASTGDAAALLAAHQRQGRLQAAIAAEDKRATDLRGLHGEIQRWHRTASSELQRIRERYPDLIKTSTWEGLTPALPEARVAEILRATEEATRSAAEMRDKGIPIEDSNRPEGPKVLTGGIQALGLEVQRLTRALGLNEAHVKRRAELDQQLHLLRSAETKANAELAHARGAPDRRRRALAERSERYQQIFGVLEEEQKILHAIYAPLMSRCARNPALKRLSITVERVVDVKAWADAGEDLFDFRRTEIKRGGIAQLATEHLAAVWRSGTAHEVATQVRDFLTKHGKGFVGGLLAGRTREQLGAWFYSTDHAAVRYGISYDGVPLSRLSPGTRGVVLLTLYLALDDQDRRPLIVDQPEENLDPKSVYTDLMPFFREAAKRRQIIMVTHNANLVVNCDSDQVIVAHSERTAPGALPTMSYRGGGLELPGVRKDVCDLLEGGHEAFRMRSERYRVAR